MSIPDVFRRCPFYSLPQFFACIPDDASVFGVDFGTKTIGIALASDVRNGIASPLKTIFRRSFAKDIEFLSNLINLYSVSGLVVGLPIEMRGKPGRMAQATYSFFRGFFDLVPIPITYWDERLSTSAVTKVLLTADISRAKRLKLVDKMAAAFILQGALDVMFLQVNMDDDL